MTIARYGIKTTYLGLAGILATLILMVIFVMATMPAMQNGSPPAFMFLLMLMYFLGYVAMFVGECMCIATPARAGRNSVIAAVVLQVASFAFAMILTLVVGSAAPNVRAGASEQQLNQTVMVLMIVVSGLMSGTSMLMYLRFLKQANLYVGNQRNATLASWTTGFLGVSFALTMMVMLIPRFMNMREESSLALMGLLSIGMILIGLISLLMFARLLHNTTRALT